MTETKSRTSLPQLFDTLLEAHSSNLAEWQDLVASYWSLHANWGRGSEDARRRLLNHELKTTYPRRRREALQAKLSADRTKMVGPLQTALRLAIEIRFTELMLEQVNESIEGRDAAADRLDTGIYENAQRFAQQLFKDHQINHAHYALLEPDDYQAIAAIITARHQANLPAVRPVRNHLTK